MSVSLLTARGGSADHSTLSANLLLTPHDFKVQFVGPTSGALFVRLPRTEIYGNGAIPFILVNISGSNNIQLRNSRNDVIATILPNTAVECVLLDNSSNHGTWFLRTYNVS